jgi:hypothetical protein
LPSHFLTSDNTSSLAPYFSTRLSRLRFLLCVVIIHYELESLHTPVHKPERAARADCANMGLSKSKRIIILLAIDTAFFFLELSVGYTVHSLALVADSFHMVHDFHTHLEVHLLTPDS